MNNYRKYRNSHNSPKLFRINIIHNLFLKHEESFIKKELKNHQITLDGKKDTITQKKNSKVNGICRCFRP